MMGLPLKGNIYLPELGIWFSWFIAVRTVQQRAAWDLAGQARLAEATLHYYPRVRPAAGTPAYKWNLALQFPLSVMSQWMESWDPNLFAICGVFRPRPGPSHPSPIHSFPHCCFTLLVQLSHSQHEVGCRAMGCDCSDPW